MSTNYRDLIVTDSEGQHTTIGTMLDNPGDHSFTGLHIASDGIISWDGRFVSAPGEEPSADSPANEYDAQELFEQVLDAIQTTGRRVQFITRADGSIEI